MKRRCFVGRISITDFSRSLKQSSLLYKKLLRRQFVNAKINQHLFNLQRIKSFPAYIFLLNLFKRKVSDAIKIEILASLETFMLRRHICEYRTNELDDIFSYLVEVDNENTVSALKNYLSQYLPDDREFEAKFASHNYKGNENRAKYALERFEYHLIQDKGEYILSTGADLHLEHIIPLTISTKKAKQEFGDWVSYLGKDALDQHKKYVNTIGNLTLLGQKLNIVASNNSFEAKLVEYRKSNITLTREISKRYRDFRFGEVLKRAAYLAKLAPSIWSFK